MNIMPDNRAPEWLHLLPAGEVRTVDGRGPYCVRNPAALVALSMAGGKLTLDENHSTDLAAPKGMPAPACGWIVQLQPRADGIWGRVEWIERAKEPPAWRQYLATSPVIVHTTAGEIKRIKRVSLVNAPNLVGLTSLHSSGLSLATIGSHIAVEPNHLPVPRLSAADEQMIQQLGLDGAAYAVQLDATRADRVGTDGRTHDGLTAADLAFVQQYGFDRVAFATSLAATRASAGQR